MACQSSNDHGALKIACGALLVFEGFHREKRCLQRWWQESGNEVAFGA